MHQAVTDQATYDILFGLFRAIVLLAGEANDKEQARVRATVRALKAEAMLRVVELERNHYKHIAVRRNQHRRARYQAKRQEAN